MQVRALDNVLDLTHWPLPQQRAEAMAKRRIGVGFTGLGNALAMLSLRYDAPEGREMAARIARRMRDAAYARLGGTGEGERRVSASSTPTRYLEAGTFASRLDEPLKQAIREHGIRNSHLLSIAPTGTVSLAFADNASNGIEPPFSWTYQAQEARRPTAARSEYDGRRPRLAAVPLAGRRHGAIAALLRLGAGDAGSRPPGDDGSGAALHRHGHLEDGQCARPTIPTTTSRASTWRPGARGLKGLATYRPNDILGSVLEVRPTAPTSRMAREPRQSRRTRCAP